MKDMGAASLGLIATLACVGCASFPSSPKPAAGVSIEAFERTTRPSDSSVETVPRARQPTRALTTDGIALLKNFEGTVRCRSNSALHCPYNDASKFCTIGYGHLIGRASCNRMKRTLRELGLFDGITEDGAEQLLAGDLSDAQLGVERHMTNDLVGITPLTGFQYDALVSLTFNIGAENFAQSTLLELVKKRKAVSEDRAIANAFSSWVKSNGVVLDGLITRRGSEARHFFKDIAIDFSLEDGVMLSEENAIDIRLGERRPPIE